MPLVELATDARWRRDATGYVEVCPRCAADRTACRCGHDFARKERRFLVTSWTPADIAVRVPSVCPHCGGAATREVALHNQQLTRLRGLTSAEATDKLVRIRVCRRTREPVWMYLSLVATVTLTVMFGLIAFAAWPAALVAAVCLVGAIGSWRAYAWVRFVGFDHRAFRFRVRRQDYADALAEANGGRVVG